MPIKIKQVQYSEKVKISYESDGDKLTLESGELPSKEFKDSFHALKFIAAKVSGITAAITRLDVVYLPEDEAQIKAISLSAELPFVAPFNGETIIKLPTIAAGEIEESDLLVVDAVIINALEYLRGNRAQQLLNFAGESE